MAYVNATINQGGFGSFQADAAGAIALYQRVLFTTTAGSDGSGKPTIVVAGVADRTIGVAMQPIAVGAQGTIRFQNAQGEQFGLATGTIGLGVAVYSAALGRMSTVSTGGALLMGISTTPGFDGGVFTYIQNAAAA